MGEELVPVVSELARWGTRFIEQSIVEVALDHQKRSEGKSFRIHWLSYPISLFLPDAPSSAPNVKLMIRIGEQTMVVDRLDGRVSTRPGVPDEPVDLMIRGSPPVIIGMLAGRLTLESATNAGFLFDGSLSVLDQLRGNSMVSRS